MRRRPIGPRTRWVIRGFACLLLLAAPAAASPPSVYHSAADGGVDPGGSVTIGPGQTTLHLYLDGGAVASSSGPCTRTPRCSRPGATRRPEASGR